MSVRPLTESEEKKAFGYPWTKIFAYIGTFEGVLLYMRRNQKSFRNNWFSSPGSFRKFFLYGAAGHIAGAAFGFLAFKDDELLGLYKTHFKDEQYKVYDQVPIVDNYKKS